MPQEFPYNLTEEELQEMDQMTETEIFTRLEALELKKKYPGNTIEGLEKVLRFIG